MDRSTTSSHDSDLKGELCNLLRLIDRCGIEEIYFPAAKANPVKSSPEQTLTSLSGLVESCNRCELHKKRTNVVFGEGNPRANLMFIGEAPGRDEDLKGRPFVGRAGMLLTKIIKAMGLSREDVYITNVVKCRPPGNRNPALDEIIECLPYLEKQIELIKPKVICALGSVAAQTLTGKHTGISSLRGRFHEYLDIPVMPTFHPAACLRKPAIKRLVWEDVKQIMEFLGLPIQGVMHNGASKS